MALNNQFKIKNDSNTLGRILSGGVDIASIFAPSNTTWRLSATNANFLVAGGDVVTILGGNGVDVRANSSTDTVTISGFDATTSTKGVASFNSASFAVTNGDVTVKSGGISNTQLAGSISDNKITSSANWNDAYNTATTYKSVSSSFATRSFTDSKYLPLTGAYKYLPLSGGELTGRLNVAERIFIYSPYYLQVGSSQGGTSETYITKDGMEIVSTAGDVTTYGGSSISSDEYNSLISLETGEYIIGGVNLAAQWDTAFKRSTVFAANSARYDNTSTIVETNSGNWNTSYNAYTNATPNNTANAIVQRGASGEFSSGSVTVTGGVSASQTVTGEILNARTGFKINNAAATAGNYLRGNGTNFVANTIQATDVPTLNQNTTGSAATLTTTRTLWGQNFNGSQNITGNLTGVGNIIGSGAVTLSASHNNNLNLVATGNGNVVIDKADINGGTIDGVSIGNSSAATYLKVDNITLDSSAINFSSAGSMTFGTWGDLNHASGGYISINGGGSAGVLTGPNSADLVIATGANNPSTARITLDEALNGNITFATHGTGNVVINRADINGGAIDGTPIGVSVASTGRFTSIAATGNVNIDGNLFVAGSAVTINATDIITKDPLIFLAQGNAGDAIDIGFAAQYTIANAVPTRFTGLVRDTATGKWNLFSGLSSSPLSSTNIVFTGNTTIVKDTLVADIEGNLTGNAGSATKLETGRTISLLGDVTYTSPSFDGTENVSASATIANNAVTYAKIQKVNYNKILGRQTSFPVAGGGQGEIEEITCTIAARELLDDESASDQRTTLGLGDTQSVTHANLILSNGSQSVLRNVYANSVASNSTMSVATFGSSSPYKSAKFVVHMKQGTTRRAVAEIIAVNDNNVWEGSVYGIVDPANIFSNVDITVGAQINLVLTFTTPGAYAATVSVEAMSD